MRCSRRPGRSGRSKDDPGAPFFNETHKYVVSATLTPATATATWRNSKAIGPYNPDAIRKLKDEVGDLYVSGSGTLVRAMLADGLVDELHLLVYPLDARLRSPAVPRRGFAPQAVARGV